jgi:O-methyltransferase
MMLSKLKKLMRDPGLYLARIHPFPAGPRRFFLQSEMDISPRSIWHNREFATATGGFMIPEDRVERRICQLEAWDHVRRDMLVLLMRSVLIRQIDGDFAELGVYQGVTARLIHHYAPDRRLHLFDTFSGFDPREIEDSSQAGQFSETSVEAVMRKIAPRNENVTVHAGRFPETASQAPGKFAFVHLDADLFDPISAGLEFFHPRLAVGGIIVVHDYNAWPGARRAVDQFFTNRAEVPIAMPDKSGSAVIVKS